MRTTLTDIRVGYRLGHLAFGVTRDVVGSYCGEPDEIEEDWQQSNPTVAWLFLSLRLTAYFAADDGFRLGMLRTTNPESQLFGTRLIGRGEEELRSILSEYHLGVAEEEIMTFSDYPALRRIYYPDSNIDFWLKDGILTA